MSVTIRKAKFEDLDRISEIEKQAFPPEEAASREKYEWRFQNYPDYFFVAEKDNKVVSVVCAIPTKLELINDDIFEMEKLPFGKIAAVVSVMADKNHRGQGITGELIKYSLLKLKENGMETSCLTCKEHLINYYSKFGYELVGVSKSIHGGAVWYDMVAKL
jgi:predicted N-acetyltransferase YhbS